MLHLSGLVSMIYVCPFLKQPLVLSTIARAYLESCHFETRNTKSTRGQRGEDMAFHGHRPPYASRSQSMGRSDGWHDRPRKWEPTSSDDLLKKRYTEMDRYRLDLNQQRFAHMGREERIQKFGSHIIPIHVPLDRGETIEAYEQRFVHWLAVRENVRLQDIRDPMAERSYRIQFANKNANESLDYKFQYRNWVPPRPPPSYRLEATDSSTMRSSGDKRRSHERESFHTQRRNSDPSQPPVATAPTDPRLSFPGRCSVTLPPTGSSLGSFTIAYMECGCRQCFTKCIGRMASHIAALEKTNAANEKSGSKTRPRVVDLTEDDDVTGPRLKRLRGLESHEIQRSSTSVDTVSSDIFDPVEKRLLGEYDELNERVLMNNRVLEMSVKRLHQGSVDNIKEATAQQEEIQVLRALIRQEMDNRDAALAMVIVYLWRKEIGDLEERIKSKDIANVPQVATKSHQHCAKIASDLVAKREELAKVKKQLDEQLEKRSSPPDSAHLSMAKELGEKIASLEREIDQLISTRRQEFQTVLQCDEHVRHLIRTVLAKA